uniref:FHA domain-containing protein n=1 Tax=Loxodonta africana TaxID=9785 RepID=G3TQR0_LOXAF
TEQDIVLRGLDLESEHCIFENVGGTVTLIPLSGSQCSVNGVQIVEATHLNQGAWILGRRTNMFRFNHPKEAAKLREKRKSGLLSSLSLSMTDLSKSCENLSAVMLYNPGLEFERQQREELEKLESKRKLIEEMEEKQKSDKAELERMQQEVETQRKETEIVQRQIRKQEESLKRRSFHIESKLKDLLAEKERAEGDDDGRTTTAQLHFLEFKRRQLVKLGNLEKDLVHQKDLLKKEVEEEQEILEHLKCENRDESRLLGKNDASVQHVTQMAQDLEKIKPVEHRLQYKERQLRYLLQNHLPALLEEKQRAFEILERGPLSLDNTLYQVEKEMEEKEEQLTQYQANASQLQKLQATFEFTANIARQEEKVRKKEKEILESREKQQREALEQAVASLERRHSALQRRSTLGLEMEEQRQKVPTADSSSNLQAGLPTGLAPDQEALGKDQERLEHEIQQLKQKICDVDVIQKEHRGTLEGQASSSGLPVSTEKSQAHLVPVMDDRINAYIEEEVQRRLQGLHRVIGSDSSVSAEVMKDKEKHHNGTIQRKLKYE